MAKTNYDTMFGKSALEQMFCTEEELRKAIELMKEHREDNPKTLQKVMIEKGIVTVSQAKRIMSTLTESKNAAQQIPGYKVLGKLGAGAMAVVYKAVQVSLDRIVAIKVLPNKFAEKKDYVDRFYKEGRIAAKLNHNNIVQAIDVGEANGLYYFVMEYVEGKTIYDDLASGKVYTEEEALVVVIQLARALSHAHNKGLIHRDVKPKNAMITTSGIVKLADLGLARATSDDVAAESEKGKAFGTPYYIAPEQIRGEVDIDGRADIYALGATLYHMVTGRVPFKAGNPSEVMKMHLKEPLTPPDHINTSLSTGIAEVIETMLAKRKEDRYATADDLLEDLEAIQRGEAPVIARRKFDMHDFAGLEQGEALDIPKEVSDEVNQKITFFKMALVGTLAVAIIELIVIIMMAAKK